MTDWPTALAQLAEADAHDAGRRYPQIVTDVGPWRGMAADAWLDRISAGASLLLAGRHAGAMLVIYGGGLSRRKAERRAVA